MATLEKIRSKQKLLFGVVIGALILFIISIADANSIRNIFGVGPGSTIAQVGGIKVDHEQYRQRVEAQSQQQQNTDREVLNQSVIQELLGEALMNEQFEKLGINITDAEISQAMTGENPHPAAMRFISSLSQALQLPAINGNTLLDAINNPTKYNLSSEMLDMMAQQYFGVPTMAAAWAAQEKDVENTLRQQIFGGLMGGLFAANELDAKSVYNDATNTANVSFVTAPYSSVADNTIEVTDADLMAKYDEMKQNYKIKEETREVDYITVNIAPSKADLDAAEVEVDRAVESLRNDSNNVVLASSFIQDNKHVRLSEVKKDRDLAMMPDSLIKKGAVYKYPKMQNTFRIAKVNDITSEIDSINVSMYVGESQANVDSIYNLLTSGGTTFKALAADYPKQAADSIWQTLVGAPLDVVNRFENAAVGQMFTFNDSVQGAHAVYVVNKRNAPKQFADIALYNYVVDPSVTTITDIKTQLNSFLASNHNADAFSQNADSLYTLHHTRITASTPKLDYMPTMQGMSSGVADSRHAIQWAMNAKKGDVSPIFEDNRDSYIVVAVKDIYSGDYLPWNAPKVKDQLTTMVKADKKGKALIDKYQGKAKDIQGYAQVMGAEVLCDSTYSFGGQRIASLPGKQSKVQAQIAAAKPGNVVGPVAGDNEVVVFVVNNTGKNERPYDFNSDGNTYVSMFGFNDAFSLLAGKRKVKNNSLKFENYEK